MFVHNARFRSLSPPCSSAPPILTAGKDLWNEEKGTLIAVKASNKGCSLYTEHYILGKKILINQSTIQPINIVLPIPNYNSPIPLPITLQRFFAFGSE
jgi:hypothetical protein